MPNQPAHVPSYEVISVYLINGRYVVTSGSGEPIDGNSLLVAGHVVTHEGHTPVELYIRIDQGNLIKIPVEYNPIHTAATPSQLVTAADGNFNLAQISQDWGVISLPDAYALIMGTGWFSVDDGSFHSGSVHLSGRPILLTPSSGLAPTPYTEVSALYQDITGTGTSALLNVSAPGLHPGFSGGAAWTIGPNGNPEIVGILSTGGQVPNSDGVYGRTVDITPEVAQQITQLAAADDWMGSTSVMKAQITQLYEVGLGRLPSASELVTLEWGLHTVSPLTHTIPDMNDVYGAAVQMPEVQLRLLYDTVFNRPPTSTEAAQWMGAIGNGESMRDVAIGILSTSEVEATYGMVHGPTEVAEILYWNVTGHTPDHVALESLSARVQADALDTILNLSGSVDHLKILGTVNALDVGGLGDPHMFS